MSKHSQETEVRCWRVTIKSNAQDILENMEGTDGEDRYILLINGEPMMEQMEPWLDGYFDDDCLEGIGDKFGIESECILMKKSELMETEQVDPCYTEQDIDDAIEYQQEMFG